MVEHLRHGHPFTLADLPRQGGQQPLLLGIEAFFVAPAGGLQVGRNGLRRGASPQHGSALLPSLLQVGNSCRGCGIAASVARFDGGDQAVGKLG